ncbi:MAG: bifunctional indole-3-glycerol-phosphate synthase TrpC/phosphoribosylanthranilate isomerase TrpF [Polyangiaceae bacterium]|nr:bifunctional indole-3-glycerol-phosphate synthase TrpC/phosphoribosylanthranilate isomerase TrpF [Polyangiaceae bacterium]
MNVLERIAAGKRAKYAGVAVPAVDVDAPPVRDIASALRRRDDRTHFILEVKPASPSAGRLRDHIEPAMFARAYGPVADAVSVLVDRTHFGGSLELLSEVRAALDRLGTPRPVLAKDIVVHPAQIIEARNAGADAVLLMTSVLDDAEIDRCLGVVERAGMGVVVETSNEAELRRALAFSPQRAPVIGINNRDLGSLKIDLSTVERLSRLVPSDRVLVSESGIASRRDVDRLAPHVDAFLAGSALVRAPDPFDAARALVVGRVKACGLRTADDGIAAHVCGARFAGLVFAPGSVRAVGIAAAREVLEASTLPGVGVFVDDEVERVARIARDLGLVAVQLHGNEPSSDVARLRETLGASCEVWRAVHPAHVETTAVTTNAAPDRRVFDAIPGGSGAPLSLDALAGRNIDRDIVAGGLRRESALDALRLEPYALDVSSALESARGVKCPRAMASFFGALRPFGRRHLKEAP